MEKLSFVFLIREDTCWNQLFSHVDNLKKSSNEVGNIAVVSVGTAQIAIAHEGGLLKVAKLESMGYHQIVLG